MLIDKLILLSGNEIETHDWKNYINGKWLIFRNNYQNITLYDLTGKSFRPQRIIKWLFWWLLLYSRQWCWNNTSLLKAPATTTAHKVRKHVFFLCGCLDAFCLDVWDMFINKHRIEITFLEKRDLSQKIACIGEWVYLFRVSTSWEWLHWWVLQLGGPRDRRQASIFILFL